MLEVLFGGIFSMWDSASWGLCSNRPDWKIGDEQTPESWKRRNFNSYDIFYFWKWLNYDCTLTSFGVTTDIFDILTSEDVLGVQNFLKSENDVIIYIFLYE